MKVAIIGTVPVSKRVAPYEDPSWEIWVCSPGNSQLGAPPRVTKWFELHALVDCTAAENAGWWPAYVAWLNAQTFPIYMQERNDLVPAALPFPRNALVAKWGESKAHNRTNWFTSSIAWMIAYAMHCGATEIGIFGVDMAATEEHYSWQKAGILRFIEIAESAGIKVTIPLESTLLYGAPQYGYAEASRMGRSLIVREHEMLAQLGQLEATIQRLQHEACFFKGALEQIRFDRRTFVSGNADAEVVFEDEAVADITELSAAATEAATAMIVPPAPTALSKVPTAADFDDAHAAMLAPPKAPRMKRKPNGAADVHVEGQQ